jgi:hypothetical protein
MIKKNYTEEDRAKYEKKLEKESRPLFAAILALAEKKAPLYMEFERFIHTHYGKEQEIKPTYLYDWAGLSEGQGLKTIPKWLLAASIDFLMAKGVNPVSIIPVSKVAEHWARARVQQASCEETCATFITEFQIPENEKPAAINAIQMIYAKPRIPSNK